MLDRVLGCADQDTEEEDDIRRESVKGILSDCELRDDVLRFLNDDESSSFVVCVDADQVERLSKLDCYSEDSYQHKEARNFATRWSSNVDCYIKIIDTEERLEISLTSVIATEVNNSMVRDFAQDFRSGIYSTFDPMAEDHDEPYLSIEPF